jgi:hypothetical protein
VLSLVSGYENLLAWAEASALERPRPASRADVRAGESLDGRWAREPAEAGDFLRAERARLSQFRQDMRFLDRRRPDAEEGRRRLDAEESLRRPDAEDGAEEIRGLRARRV